MNDSITGLRHYRGIKPYNKRFQVAVTQIDFWGAVMAIALDLSDEQEDVKYDVRNISEGSFEVYKWWRSKIDPERINESTIIYFRRIVCGSMLLQIEARIYQRVGIRTAEEETAWRILREIGLRFPESRLDTPSSAPQKPDDQAGEPLRPGRRELRAHERARERLRTGEDEATIKADWRKDYEDETGMTPAQTASGEKELWRNVKRAVKIDR